MVEYKSLPDGRGTWVVSTQNTAKEQDGAIRKVIADCPHWAAEARNGDQAAFNTIAKLVFAELEGLDYDPVLTKEFIEMYLRAAF